jgi:S1-C subfamily serine protease
MKRIMTLATCVVCWSLGASSAPAQPVLDRVEQLLRRQLETPRAGAGDREPGYLGMVADDRQEQGRGVRVLSVAPNGPAATAGIEKGDLITAIDGRAVRSMDDMVTAMTSRGPNATVTITADRNGTTTERRVTLTRRPAATGGGDTLPPPAAPSRPKLGIRTIDVTEAAQRENKLPDAQGATVILIAPGSPADRAGIPMGAVIRAVGDTTVRNPQELAAMVASAKDARIELTYVFAATETKARIDLAADDRAPRELRSRPVQPPAPSPSADELPPPAADDARISALEAKVRELEARVEKLEAAAAGAK